MTAGFGTKLDAVSALTLQEVRKHSLAHTSTYITWCDLHMKEDASSALATQAGAEACPSDAKKRLERLRDQRQQQQQQQHEKQPEEVSHTRM